MSRPRVPAAKAKVTAAAAKNPQRHRGRKAAGGAALGKPSPWLSRGGRTAFASFKRELPWLKESHRVIVELASHLRGHLIEPPHLLGLQGMQELRRCLGALGATPADESKVTLPDDDAEDPEEAFFSKPN
jgi:hypothetical protein